MSIVKKLTDMEIDEISLVDRPANQHAKVLISKRDNYQEGTVPEIYNEEGLPLDEADLTDGDIVFDEEGNPFVVSFDPEPEPVAVGKSFAEELREELSKSIGDKQRDDVIAKALGKVEEADKRASKAEEIAKAERHLRLSREYEEVAKGYGLPVDPSELAPALMAIAEGLPYEVGAVIHKALTAAGSIFDEVGYTGGNSNNDVLSMVDRYIEENISKADISKAEAVEAVFLANPAAYDEYLRTR
jgi:hypothetical protein